jgi:hypothetical protein
LHSAVTYPRYVSTLSVLVKLESCDDFIYNFLVVLRCNGQSASERL